jgi:hypothetical protein
MFDMNDVERMDERELPVDVPSFIDVAGVGRFKLAIRGFRRGSLTAGVSQVFQSSSDSVCLASEIVPRTTHSNQCVGSASSVIVVNGRRYAITCGHVLVNGNSPYDSKLSLADPSRLFCQSVQAGSGFELPVEQSLSTMPWFDSASGYDVGLIGPIESIHHEFAANLIEVREHDCDRTLLRGDPIQLLTRRGPIRSKFIAAQAAFPVRYRDGLDDDLLDEVLFCEACTESGDSGACLVDEQKNAIGIHTLLAAVSEAVPHVRALKGEKTPFIHASIAQSISGLARRVADNSQGQRVR